MKKTIIILSAALMAFSGTTFANNGGNPAAPVSKVSSEYAKYYATPLVVAITKGEIEVVKKFVEYGADVNEMTNGMTPLMYAARYNRVEIMKFLVSKGAKIEVEDKKGFTALKHAQLSNATEAAEYLKSLGLKK